MLLLTCGGLLAQTPTKTIPFKIEADDEERAVFGAVVREKGRWEVYSVGIVVHSVNVRKQRCRVTLTGQGSDSAVLKKKKRISAGKLTEYELMPGQPKVSLEVQEVTDGSCRGLLKIASEFAEDWRNLADGPVGGEGKVEAYKYGAEDVEAPRLVKQTHPPYTQKAIDALVQGTCLLQTVVDEKGETDPDSFKILRSVGYGLDEAAIEDIMNHWKFIP
ncbi:MAG TPA: energy transducer TonB, partial [Acidobacteriota bacterium]|nr:energy transducer TonB [Acidobacteriota bacterium]